MDQLYERMFGPYLDAYKKAISVLRKQNIKKIPGITNLKEDANAKSISFTLAWKFRGENKQKHLNVFLRFFKDEGYVSHGLNGDESAKKLLEKNPEAFVLVNFFSQFMWQPNVRTWPKCQCGAADLTIDVDLAMIIDDIKIINNEFIAYIPILQHKHRCLKVK